MAEGIAPARTILFALVCLLLAAPPALSRDCPPLPARLLNSQQRAEVKKETEAALHADFDAKAALVTKYLRVSEETRIRPFSMSFARLALDDTHTGIADRFRLMSLVGKEETRRGLPPGSEPPTCPPPRPSRTLNARQIADVHAGDGSSPAWRLQCQVRNHSQNTSAPAARPRILPAATFSAKSSIEDKSIGAFSRVRLYLVVRHQRRAQHASGLQARLVDKSLAVLAALLPRTAARQSCRGRPEPIDAPEIVRIGRLCPCGR